MDATVLIADDDRTIRTARRQALPGAAPAVCTNRREGGR